MVSPIASPCRKSACIALIEYGFKSLSIRVSVDKYLTNEANLKYWAWYFYLNTLHTVTSINLLSID
ncbi:hypothetical protein [Vibrio gallaecicus]|uniref:hypothetical protein n=1 Tax=Vibrio gallaecicus TaxID=552386 RepID=UPI0025B4FA32|nr:hypothetical protein [Vibrio gallaecicus]MDN3617777.1 hypothetical protein [Vibrio gallaecicus]